MGSAEVTPGASRSVRPLHGLWVGQPEAHGLRHSYAQERMQELLGRGVSYNQARELVSQELGHFRGGYSGGLPALRPPPGF